MFKRSFLRAGATLLSFAVAPSAFAWDANDWPTHYTFDNGLDVGLVAAYRFDTNDFSDDTLPNGRPAFEDSHTNRRKELGLSIRKKGVFDALIDYEYQGHTWLDTYVRVQSQALFGADYGAFRLGYTKTPVSFEGATSTKANSFLELTLPVQAIFVGRRTGIDWAFERPRYIVNVGWYFGQDLLGDNDGRTWAARTAWTPRKSAGDLLHLGISASRERRYGTTDGRDIFHPPTARVSSPPETGLTPVRLVDSGTLSGVDHIDRGGLEALWIDGPWSLQGEVLRERVARTSGLPTFAADGFYVFGSWVLTGESRPYSGGYTGNIKPNGAGGAWELLLRYSELDLNSGAVAGGREHDWTLGVNWYLTEHFKFQANYIRATSERGNLALDPQIVETRVQIYF
jgi:phosphate-selective porin OprO/OprP